MDLSLFLSLGQLCLELAVGLCDLLYFELVVELLFDLVDHLLPQRADLLLLEVNPLLVLSVAPVQCHVLALQGLQLPLKNSDDLLLFPEALL